MFVQCGSMQLKLCITNCFSPDGSFIHTTKRKVVDKLMIDAQ